MKVSNQKNPLHRIQSPTLSDGSNPKRLHLGSDDLDPDEKFEKLRRIDSPTETSPRLGMQFSPQIGGMSLSGKGSPKDNPNKRSVSPKALYPPSIQKFLNGKSTLTIEEAIEKLKVPSNKTHKGQLEKMKMLGAFQKQEVASNVAFRKAYSNSPASVSPARSTSPVGSPMVISPRHDNMSNFQESENIVMTFEDESDGPLSGAGLMESAMGKMNFPKQNVDNWLSNMGVQGNNGMFQQDNHQQGHFNNNSRPQQSNMQMNQGNFGGNNPMQGGQRPPFNQFQQNSNNNNNQSGRYQSLTPQALAFLNSQSQDQGDYRDRGSRYEDDESRERTNSFLRLPRDLANPPESNYRSLAETQLNAIQSIMKATRAISPTEPNRGVMQQFQKRNSNPESMMMNNGPMQMQMQQPLFENRPSAFNQGMMQDFNTGYNGSMQQQYSQYNNNMQQQGQGMFSMQNQHQMHMDNGYNNQNNMTKREYAPQQQQQQHPTPYGGYGQGPNMGMQGHESKQGMGTYNDQMAWNMQNQLSGDPEAFLFEKNETEDFDLNIIPSDLNFMPNRQGMEELADPNDNNLIVPDPTGMDPFFNNGPHGMFRFSS